MVGQKPVDKHIKASVGVRRNVGLLYGSLRLRMLDWEGEWRAIYRSSKPCIPSSLFDDMRTKLLDSMAMRALLALCPLIYHEPYVGG
jgi:hypothetical protein